MRLLILAITQSILLVMGQVTLKMALMRMSAFSWTMAFWKSMLTNWQFALCGIFFGAASLLWMYMLRHFPLSTVYPLVSLSFLFGAVAAMVFFHEDVTIWKWIGVLLIMTGCAMVVSA